MSGGVVAPPMGAASRRRLEEQKMRVSMRTIVIPDDSLPQSHTVCLLCANLNQRAHADLFFL
jgi:hypothetical protein